MTFFAVLGFIWYVMACFHIGYAAAEFLPAMRAAWSWWLTKRRLDLVVWEIGLYSRQRRPGWRERWFGRNDDEEVATL